MTITSTAPTIDANGIHVPAYSDILDFLQTGFQNIFGSDIYLGPDSQDGQMVAIFASSVNDANSCAAAVYNCFSPSTAAGIGLSSVVRINGLTRQAGSNSTCDVTLTGQAGTTVVNGVVTDIFNNQWSLPASVIIPGGGTITVTATCVTTGAIAASIGTLTGIGTPTYGWQSVTNASAASPGTTTETDAALRIRQGTSVALPSLSILGGTVGAVLDIAGVTEVKAYENDTSSTDANGLPPKSISLVVEGGDATAIATAILQKKGPGCGTYGTTTEYITDPITAIVYPINFYRPTNVPVTVGVTLNPLTNYTTGVGVEIQNAVSAYINALAIGQNVAYSRLYVPANLQGPTAVVNNPNDPFSYEITALTLNSGTSDVSIAFNQQATCTPSAVTITVL